MALYKGQFSRCSQIGKNSSNKCQIRQLQVLICVCIENLPSCQHLMQRREINTTSEAKHTKVFAYEDVVKTNNTKNVIENTKEETLTFKHSYTQKPNE